MTVEYKSFVNGIPLKFNVKNGFSFQRSSQQILLSDVVIDFRTNLLDSNWTPTEEDYPVKFQELKFYDGATLIFSGYLNDFQREELSSGSETLDLFLDVNNPMTYAANRTVSAELVGNLKTEINKILSPLIAAGFTVVKNTIPATTTVNRRFVERTVESILNQFSKEYNFIWYINEAKEISIIDTDGALSETPSLIVNDLSDACFSILPIVQTVDYANVISVKNARVIEFYRRDNNKINGSQIVQLEKPFSISENQLKREELGNLSTTIGIGVTDIGGSLLATVYWDKTLEQRIFIDCAYADDQNADDYSVLLIADSFDRTVITGFYINDNLSYTNIRITSDVALAPTFKTVEIPDEISKMVGIVSDDGRVQRIIDVNQRIFTETELVQFAVNNIRQNATGTNLVEIKSRTNLGLDIADKVSINLSDLLISGDFLVTEIDYTRRSTQDVYIYKARNTNFTENWIDIYRRQELEPTQEEFDNQGFAVLVTDEEIIEKPLVKIDGVLANEIT